MVEDYFGGRDWVWAYLWLVTGDFTVDWGEHAASFAAGNTEIDANIGFQAHATTLERCIDGQMDRIVAFSGIIFVNNRTVIGYFMTGSPPS